MSLKNCPKHGSYNTAFCPCCEQEGLSLCIHCGLDLNTLDSIEQMLDHIESHKNDLDEKSKKLLNFCKKINYDEALKGNYDNIIKGE